MTLQEARQQLDACENQITDIYSNLQNVAKSMGSDATQAASRKTTISTLWPLIISLAGTNLLVTAHLLLGLDLKGALLVVAYNTRQSAVQVQKNVEGHVGEFYGTLNRNSKI